jgi:histidine triad (HIT) family protein
MTNACIFCEIVSGDAEASIIYEDEKIMAFMTLDQIRPGEFLVIPKQHIDHLTDVPDELASHMFLVAKRFAKNAHERLSPRPLRMGMVVHGFSVHHAHLVVVPQHDENDITSGQITTVVDGQIAYSTDLLPRVERADLDELARLLRDD